jgi:hypothetical protein
MWYSGEGMDNYPSHTDIAVKGKDNMGRNEGGYKTWSRQRENGLRWMDMFFVEQGVNGYTVDRTEGLLGCGC